MFEVFHLTCLVLGLILAPAFLLTTLAYKLRHQHILMEWKKPQLVVFTIFAFILNISLFIIACFFLACYLGRIDGIPMLADMPSQLVKQLGIDSVLLLFGTTAMYVGIQNYFIQYITQEGIVKRNHRPGRTQPEMIRWADIKDYYVRSDYPVTYFSFIVQENELRYGKETLKVPFYALPKFENILEHSLEREKEIRAESRERLRRMSE